VEAILSVESPRAEHEPQGQLLGLNAVVESFFGSLKKERIKKQIYNDRELATADVAQYIDSFLQVNPPPQPSWRRESRAVRSGS
jgi:transposase InsO family protein